MEKIKSLTELTKKSKEGGHTRMEVNATEDLKRMKDEISLTNGPAVSLDSIFQ